MRSFFADPGILKVMHGADHDVKWLQRDFEIEVVNLFDTGQAMRVLGYESFSLAHLFSVHLGVEMEKEAFQTADWRVRPLPEEMKCYARDDTHSLLHLHDVLRQRAEMAGQLPEVQERSRRVAELRYVPPSFSRVDAVASFEERKRKE